MKKPSAKSRKFNHLKALLIASVTVNVLLLTGYITFGVILHEPGYALVNAVNEYECSSEFREKMKTDIKEAGSSEAGVKLLLAGQDYTCQDNGGGKFYQDGFEKYFKSLE